MEKKIIFREAQPEEIQAITDLVLEVFDKYVGPGFSPEGQSVFRMYCQPNAMSTRLMEGTSFCLVATIEEKIVGIIEIRNGNHIALLFVDDHYHKNGIAKNLVALAIEKANVTEIDVHASQYAVNIYASMGFQPLDKEQERDGIRFTPMKKQIEKAHIV